MAFKSGKLGLNVSSHIVLERLIPFCNVALPSTWANRRRSWVSSIISCANVVTIQSRCTISHGCCPFPYNKPFVDIGRVRCSIVAYKLTMLPWLHSDEVIGENLILMMIHNHYVLSDWESVARKTTYRVVHYYPILIGNHSMNSVKKMHHVRWQVYHWQHEFGRIHLCRIVATRPCSALTLTAHSIVGCLQQHLDILIAHTSTGSFQALRGSPWPNLPVAKPGWSFCAQNYRIHSEILELRADQSKSSNQSLLPSRQQHQCMAQRPVCNSLLNRGNTPNIRLGFWLCWIQHWQFSGSLQTCTTYPTMKSLEYPPCAYDMVLTCGLRIWYAASDPSFPVRVNSSTIPRDWSTFWKMEGVIHGSNRSQPPMLTYKMDC